MNEYVMAILQMFLVLLFTYKLLKPSACKEWGAHIAVLNIVSSALYERKKTNKNG